MAGRSERRWPGPSRPVAPVRPQGRGATTGRTERKDQGRGPVASGRPCEMPLPDRLLHACRQEARGEGVPGGRIPNLAAGDVEPDQVLTMPQGELDGGPRRIEPVVPAEDGDEADRHVVAR